jgi:hypothetical protein
MPGRRPTPPRLHPHAVVAARRRGRTAFGVVLAASVIVVPLAAIGLGHAGWDDRSFLLRRQMAGLGIPVVLAVASAAYLLRWALGAAARRLRRAVSARGRKMASPAAPGAAFGSDLAEAHRFERSSLVWPAFGLGLVAPLASPVIGCVHSPRCPRRPLSVVAQIVIWGRPHILLRALSANAWNHDVDRTQPNTGGGALDAEAAQVSLAPSSALGGGATEAM